MIKYLTLLFNTIALLIYQFFFADAISVTQKIPASVKAGGEFTVEISIKKGDVDGFAKLQEDLPEGFTAEEGNSAGASFTFSNQSVKFIWMALPGNTDIKVSYKVKVDSKTDFGDKTIAGRFAYIVDNVKQQVDIAPSVIKVSGISAPVVNNSLPNNTTEINIQDDITVSGYYLDENGAPIPNLKVNLVNKKGEIIKTVITDKEGYFAFYKLPHDSDNIVAVDANDTHIVGRNSAAQYKDSKGTIIETKPLTGNDFTSKPDDITIAGNYFDEKGAPVANLKVNLLNKKGEIIKTVFTDKNGYFAFSQLPHDSDNIVALEANDTHLIGKNSEAQIKDKKGSIIETKKLTGNTMVAFKYPDVPVNLTASKGESNGLICIRKTPQNITDESFFVEVSINKGNLSGFAKYVEILPAGLTATAVEKEEAAFSFVNQKIKFAWISLPKATSFKIVYKVTGKPSGTGDQKIDGSFSYIENDETKKYTLPVTILPAISTVAKVEPVVTQPEPTSKPIEPVKEPEPVVKQVEPVKQPEVVTTNTTTVSEPKVDNTAKQLSASIIPSPQGEAIYSVQIAALHKAKAPEVIASYYNITEPVKTEMANGLTKYTVGDHKAYKEAHDARELIKTKGVKDAWVTAYNKGKRITVQEALMITSQKWYK